MKTKRTIELTIETRSVCVQRRFARQALIAWCDGCRSQVEMVRPDEAAQRAGISSRAIYRQVEHGQLHFIETPEGSLLICLDSIT